MTNPALLEHREFCWRHLHHVRFFDNRCTRGVQQKLAQLVIDVITHLVGVLISACCVARFHNVPHAVPHAVPQKGGHRHRHLENVQLVPTLGTLLSVIRRAVVLPTWQWSWQARDPDLCDIEHFVAFSVKGQEGCPVILCWRCCVKPTRRTAQRRLIPFDGALSPTAMGNRDRNVFG